MINTRPVRLSSFALAVALGTAWALSGVPAQAKEPVIRFMEGLQRREMYDAAVLYLESLRTNPNLDPDFKALLPYLEGSNLLESAKRIRDVPVRFKQLDRAREKFREFLKNSPKHPKAGLANSSLGNVLVERANAKVFEAEQAKNKDRRPALLKEARSLFEEAETVFEKAVKQFEAKLEEYPKFIDPKKEADLYEERQGVRSDYLLVRLFAAQVVYAHSKAYDEGSEDRKKLLKKAAEMFGKIAERFRTRMAGLTALVKEGRCYQELGDTKQALARYDQILVSPATDPNLRKLQAEVLGYAMECLKAEDKVEEAVKRGEEWVKGLRGIEERQLENLGIKLKLGELYHGVLGTLKDNEKPRVMRAARRHVADVARLRSPLQDDAQKLLAKLGGPEYEGAETFDKVYQLAKQSLDMSQLHAREAAETKPPKQKQELEKKAVEARQEAFNNFKKALFLNDEQGNRPPVEKLNQVRYFLAYLHYLRGEFYHSAVIGEHLAAHYPESSVGRPSSKIALAAYLKAYNDTGENDFEADKMEDVAQLIIKQWPKEKEADDARMTMVDILIRSGRLERLTEVLAGISEQSPVRASAELKAGKALWSEYLQQSIKPIEGRPPKEKLEAMAEQSEKLLSAGLAKAKEQSQGAISDSMLTGQLSLAQMYTSSGQYGKAVALLDNPKDGILTLIKKNHPAAQSGNFKTVAYKVALQAYVGTRENEKAEEAMTALEDIYRGKGAEAEASLTRIFLKLGQEIQTDIEVLIKQGKTKEANEALQAFETFLVKIKDREKGNTWKTLTWAADTFYGLGEAAKKENRLRSDSERYFGHAASTYKRLLDNVTKNPAYIPDEKARALHVPRFRIKLALCSREVGKYEQALDQFRTILKEKATTINAQVEAARTYQQWGREKKDPKILYKAMAGSDPDKKTRKDLIWGWAQMARVLQKYVEKYPQFESTFHEARYNLAECYYERARLGDAKEKKEDLERAERAIAVTYQLYPEMGGEDLKLQYDLLLKRIQRENNKQATGLKGLDEQRAEASKG